MFCVVALLATVNISGIPPQFRSLVGRAILNSKTKVSKDLREETKYPGIYNGSGYHFRLTKVATGPRTNDIKGFSVEENFCAIVRRKAFNITGKFVFLDPYAQKIFKIRNIVGQEDNIDVYEVKEISMFEIMTDFEMKVSTYTDISDKLVRKDITLIKAKQEVSANWDPQKDKPIVYEIPKTEGVKFGLGGKVMVQGEAILAFKSLFDICLKFNVQIDAKVGLDIVVPKIQKTIEKYELKKEIVPIPLLSTNFVFLGLEFAFSTTFKHHFYLENTEFSVPVGFEYFKGYRYLMTKNIEIRINSISNPDWVIEKTSLHDQDDVDAAISALKQASFKSTLVQEGYFNFQLFYPGSHTKLHLGYRVPYSLNIGFDDKKCLFPYLQGTLSIPLYLFFEFDGLKILGATLIKPTGEKSILIFTIKIGPFCIGKNSQIQEGSAIQGKFPDAFTITSTGLTEVLTAGEQQVEKSIVMTIEDPSKTVVHSKLALPFTKLSSTPTENQMQLVAKDIPATSEIRWYLKYRTAGGGYILGSSFVSKKVSDIKFDAAGLAKLNLQISKKSGSNSDVTKFTSTIQKSNVVDTEKMFTRKLKYVTAELKDSKQKSKYYLYTIDKKGVPSFDKKSVFRTDGMVSNDFATTGYYNNYQDSYEMNLQSIQCAAIVNRIDVKIAIEKSDGKETDVNSYSTPALQAGTTEGKNLDINSNPKFYLPTGAKFKISGNVVIDNKPNAFSFTYNELKLGKFDIKIQDNPAITITYNVVAVKPLVTITSSTYPVPTQEVVAEVIDVPGAHWGSLKLKFDGDETYKILRIPGVQGATKLFLYYSGGELSFLSENLVTISDQVVVINLLGVETEIEIPIRCYETKDKDHEIKFAFCEIPAVQYRITSEGVNAVFKSDIPKVFIVPVMKNKYFIDTLAPDDFKFKDFSFNIDPDTIVYFVERTSQTEASVTYYSTYTYLADNNPVVTQDLSYLKDIIAKKKGVKYYVINAHDGKKVNAKSSAIEMEAAISDGIGAMFLITSAETYTFSIICSDPSEEACLITYPVPEKSGYHLIKYPSRDGISTTGAGFLTEVIPVKAGVSFDYYKISKGAVTKIREYSEKPIKASMKVQDTDKIEGLSMARKFCLYDGSNQILPFSRKYFSEHLNDLVESIGISLSKLDANFFKSDDDGCLIIHGYYVESNEFLPAKEIIDIPLSEEISVDASGVTIKPGSIASPTPVPEPDPETIIPGDGSGSGDVVGFNIGEFVGIIIACLAFGAFASAMGFIIKDKCC